MTRQAVHKRNISRTLCAHHCNLMQHTKLSSNSFSKKSHRGLTAPSVFPGLNVIWWQKPFFFFALLVRILFPLCSVFTNLIIFILFFKHFKHFRVVQAFDTLEIVSMFVSNALLTFNSSPLVIPQICCKLELTNWEDWWAFRGKFSCQWSVPVRISGFKILHTADFNRLATKDSEDLGTLRIFRIFWE